MKTLFWQRFLCWCDLEWQKKWKACPNSVCWTQNAEFYFHFPAEDFCLDFLGDTLFPHSAPRHEWVWKWYRSVDRKTWVKPRPGEIGEILSFNAQKIVWFN